VAEMNDSLPQPSAGVQARALPPSLPRGLGEACLEVWAKQGAHRAPGARSGAAWAADLWATRPGCAHWDVCSLDVQSGCVQPCVPCREPGRWRPLMLTMRAAPRSLWRTSSASCGRRRRRPRGRPAGTMMNISTTRWTRSATTAPPTTSGARPACEPRAGCARAAPVTPGRRGCSGRRSCGVEPGARTA